MCGQILHKSEIFVEIRPALAVVTSKTAVRDTALSGSVRHTKSAEVEVWTSLQILMHKMLSCLWIKFYAKGNEQKHEQKVTFHSCF